MGRVVTALRLFIARHARLAALLLALALAMRALVPAGYMIDSRTDFLTVTICSGVDQHSTIKIPFERKSGSGEHQGKAQGDSPCVFSALGMAALGGADAPLLAIALAFVLALGFAPIRLPLLQRARHLLPPAHGPPALI